MVRLCPDHSITMSIEEKTAFRWRMGPTAFLVTATLWLTILQFGCLPVAAQFSAPSNVSCACPNQNLTFDCTVMGSGSTLWTGSAFSSCPTNQIILRHNRFADGTTGTCREGAIVARSIGVESGNYTSQLTVSVSSGFNDQTVMCILNSDDGMRLVGEANLTVITVPIDQVPNGVSLTKVEPEVLMFSWTTVNTKCPSINYLASSNCSTWSCVNPTDTTTAICSGLQLPSVCTFTVQTEVCGQVGSPSEPIRVTLRVPNVPVVDIIVPVYSAETRDLLLLKANITNHADSFNISDTVSVSITSYSISYNSANTVTFSRNATCVEDTCEYFVNVPSDLCPSSNDISVALSASNRLGQGPPSDPTTIGCTNQFVLVEHDRTIRTITCRFLDETDTSVKSCSITYGQCDLEAVPPRLLRNYSTMVAPNIVNIELPADADSIECYNVTASSDLFTVIIVQDIRSKQGNGRGVVAAAIIIPIVVIIILVLFTVLFVVLAIKKRSRGTHEHLRLRSSQSVIQMEILSAETDTALDINEIQATGFLDLKNSHFSRHDVEHDCELREFVENNIKTEFKRGCAFYEFKHEFESITEDKAIIIIEESFDQLYFYTVNRETHEHHQLIGSKVPRPNLKGSTRVFVQSTGSGVRHLPAGSQLIYENKSSWTQSPSFLMNKPDPPLKPVISSHFEVTPLTIDRTMTIQQIRKEKKLPLNFRVFIELSLNMNGNDVIDVIVQDKKSKMLSLYTGPAARQMVKKYFDNNGRKHPDNKWRVFVLCKDAENVELNHGSYILCQKPNFTQMDLDEFRVLSLAQDEKCIQCMSEFVKREAQLDDFTNGNAYYEFKEEEDLEYYKDVILLPEDDGFLCVGSPAHGPQSVDSQDSRSTNTVAATKTAINGAATKHTDIPKVKGSGPAVTTSKHGLANNKRATGAESANCNSRTTISTQAATKKEVESVTDTSSQSLKLVTTGIDQFYKLPGVPAVGVKPPNFKGYRVFIQSTSQGARCVKPGDTILYYNKKTT